LYFENLLLGKGKDAQLAFGVAKASVLTEQGPATFGYKANWAAVGGGQVLESKSIDGSWTVRGPGGVLEQHPFGIGSFENPHLNAIKLILSAYPDEVSAYDAIASYLIFI
jgi:hypothetical protein